MGQSKEIQMELQEELLRHAYNEWEIEKMLNEMTIEQIRTLIKQADQKLKEKKTHED